MTPSFSGFLLSAGIDLLFVLNHQLFEFSREEIITEIAYLCAMRKIIIAIDGFSACGKSTTAKAVAKRLGYGFIDSGAMYRAVTLYFLENNVSFTNEKAISTALDAITIEFRYSEENERNEIFLNGQNVEDRIRTLDIAKRVSEASAIKMVRVAMVSQQQKMGKEKGIVMDGRDIGTDVFPEAELKIFMTADKKIRAERRQKELLERGDVVDLEDVMENIRHRDHLDSTREESPLRKAENAWELDNTSLTMEEQVEVVLKWVDEKIKEILLTESVR